jgi:hypothetical protein
MRLVVENDDGLQPHQRARNPPDQRAIGLRLRLGGERGLLPLVEGRLVLALEGVIVGDDDRLLSPAGTISGKMISGKRSGDPPWLHTLSGHVREGREGTLRPRFRTPSAEATCGEARRRDRAPRQRSWIDLSPRRQALHRSCAAISLLVSHRASPPQPRSARRSPPDPPRRSSCRRAATSPRSPATWRLRARRRR